MAENRQKVKLIKLYELLRKETDEDHPISRVELCRRLNEMDISSNVRTLSEDIKVLTDNGFEIESFLKDKEKFYYVPEHELTIPEIKILIDALQAATFVTEKKTGELVEKVAALGGSHKAELLKELLPKALKLKLYAALLDSSTAEHAARTVAMQTATDNAENLLAELTLQYNKGRQQKITSEILDLAGGQAEQ